MKKAKSFKEVEAEWYELLKVNGFQEIEDVKNPNRPLIEWHSLKCRSVKFQIIKEQRTEYQKKIDDFLNHKSFLEACESLIKHGNSKFTKVQIQKIWECHVKGLTIRKTAREVGRSKSSVHEVIKGLKVWMSLL